MIGRRVPEAAVATETQNVLTGEVACLLPGGRRAARCNKVSRQSESLRESLRVRGCIGCIESAYFPLSMQGCMRVFECWKPALIT